ncbi:hypothetical protein [Serinicoccus sp. CUA-874]|uniref:hypothetical protein n=1 Tax=Serinicoccus sp. CUA-874 TaxID=1517939 RepID=UPI00117AF84C|nr:hypothetical protein [Serinicoccus sp. CUA-874]
MDVLKVRLGPVLPYWPAGLVLHCSLQGDVVTEARAEVLGAADEAGDETDARAARSTTSSPSWRWRGGRMPRPRHGRSATRHWGPGKTRWT